MLGKSLGARFGLIDRGPPVGEGCERMDEEQGYSLRCVSRGGRNPELPSYLILRTREYVYSTLFIDFPPLG